MPPGRLADRVGLGAQGRGGREVAAPRGGYSQGAQHDRQLVERTGVAGEPDLPGEHRAPGVVVPQRADGRLSHPAPAEGFLRRDVSADEGAHRSLQRRPRSGRPVRHDQRQAVQHQVDRPHRPRGRGKGPGGAADLEQVAGARQMSGEQCRHPCPQVGFTGQVDVERLEPPGRLEQQCGRVAARARGEHNLPAQQVHPGAGEIVQRTGLCRSQQLKSLAERAGLQVGLRRRQDAFGVSRRIDSQRH